MMQTWVFILFSRLLIGAAISSAVATDTIAMPTCEEGNWFEKLLDIASGCGLEPLGILVAAAFGFIPGAPILVNTSIAGVTNAMMVWNWTSFLRGTPSR